MKSQLPNKPVQRCKEWIDDWGRILCNRPAKYIKIGLTGKQYLCGIHARQYRDNGTLMLIKAKVT